MITINGTEVQDPSSYSDNYDQFFTDNRSLSLRLQRNRLGKKKMATLTWTTQTPAELDVLLALFQEGDEVAFSNTASSFGTFTFDGIPDLPLSLSEYEKGGTYMRDLTVTLREV